MVQQVLDLRLGKGGDHLPRRRGHLDPLERAGGDNALGLEPGEEAADAPHVGVDGMPGEAARLRVGRRVVLETASSLQVDDEGPDLHVRYFPGIGGGAVAGQEFGQVAYTVGDDVDRVLALAFGGGVERIYGSQAP